MHISAVAHKVAHFAAVTLNNPYGLGTLGLLLVFVPIIGMHLVHKYGWQHWEPFSKHHMDQDLKTIWEEMDQIEPLTPIDKKETKASPDESSTETT